MLKLQLYLLLLFLDGPAGGGGAGVVGVVLLLLHLEHPVLVGGVLVLPVGGVLALVHAGPQGYLVGPWGLGGPHVAVQPLPSTSYRLCTS